MAKPYRDEETIDQKMMGRSMKTTCQGLGFSFSFDGELLGCKPKWKLSSLSFMELPVNVLLDYRYSSNRFFGCLRLYMNSYRFGQQKPEIRVLKPIYLIRPSPEFQAGILSAFDQVIKSNLQGTNLGLYHLPVEAMQEFYKLRSQNSESQKLASMHIAYSAASATDTESQVISLPEPHHMAS